MGFIKPYLPDVDPDTFLQKPLMERMRILAGDWAENGFGSPKMIHTIYIAKLIVFFAIGGIAVATLTSGLPAFWHVSQWWNQPIVYQKVILWTVLLEAIGVAGSWGPLAGKVKPMTGGILFWCQAGNHPASAVEVGAVHQRRPTQLVRHRPLPGTAGELGFRVTGARRAQRLAVESVAGQYIRARQPISDGRAYRAACPDRSAGQDHLPGRPRRAVPAGHVDIRRSAIREHDHRAEVRHCGGVGRRRLLEVW